MAYEGGVMYLESDASFAADNDVYTKNLALTYGGVISVSSRSAFNFTNS
jgi:hypothetical protein